MGQKFNIILIASVSGHRKTLLFIGVKLPNKAGVFIGSTKNIHWFKSVRPLETVKIFVGLISDLHIQKVKKTQILIRN